MIHAVMLSRGSYWKALGDDTTHPDEYDSSWKLMVTGPIVTSSNGDAGPWVNYSGTRAYKYHENALLYPPPHFPKPEGRWVNMNWQVKKPS
jgi:hypothetical protein